VVGMENKITGKEIIDKLLEKGFEAYYIGGYVRDKLLNKEPNDIDIVTNARPKEIIAIFKDRKTDEVGKSFGVVLVDGIDVATYRKDIYLDADSNVLKVQYADTLLEDVQRRDLTINAIAMDVNGKIIDTCNGVLDLNNKLIRFVGSPKEKIFRDPARIIRACRFLADINGKFEYKTFSALRGNRLLVNKVAKERIRKEILKAMKTQRASKFFIACENIKILEYIFPSLSRCKDVSQNKYHDEDIFKHNMMTGDKISTKYPLLKLTGYIHDIGKVGCKEFSDKNSDYTFLGHDIEGKKLAIKELKQNKFSNSEIEYISSIIRLHMNIVPKTKKGVRKLLNKLYEKNIPYKDYLRLKLADRYAKIKDGKHSDRSISDIKAKLTSFNEVIDEKEPFSLKNLEINGNDLKDIGFEQGKYIGFVLEALFKIILDDPEKNNREFLLEEAKTYL